MFISGGMARSEYIKQGKEKKQKEETKRMKKALRETQTLRAGCDKADQKKFVPPQTPSRGRGTAKI